MADISSKGDLGTGFDDVVVIADSCVVVEERCNNFIWIGLVEDVLIVVELLKAAVELAVVVLWNDDEFVILSQAAEEADEDFNICI